MDENPRRDDGRDDRNREASDAGESDQRYDLARRRTQVAERPALTPRERDERWPIG